MNIIIITGASSGIGMEFARQMDAHFSNIDEFWLIARRRDQLEALAGRLQHRCRILSMDITKDAQLERLEDTLQEKNAVVRMLINAAGYGILGKFDDQDRESELGMVRLNCEALTNITHRLIPYMRRGSRIIQIASVAAFLPQINFAVYAATKAYVHSFSRALGEELRDQGIYVTSVCPGPVDTPFFDRAEKTGNTMEIKKYAMVKADGVVAKALRDSYHKLPVSLYSPMMHAFAGIIKFVPHGLCLKVMKWFK